MVFTIHGPVKISITKIPSNFGMKDRVSSLIWVAAWKMLTAKPMVSALSSSGAEIISVISTACCPMVMTVSGVMMSGVKALCQRADYQIPAVGQHEQHDLEGQRNDRR